MLIVAILVCIFGHYISDGQDSDKTETKFYLFLTQSKLQHKIQHTVHVCKEKLSTWTHADDWRTVEGAS
jgi:hypothetical protein